MKRLIVFGIIALLIFGIVLLILNDKKLEDDKLEEPKYQGPVPEGYDEEHFRNTGETIPINSNG